MRGHGRRSGRPRRRPRAGVVGPRGLGAGGHGRHRHRRIVTQFGGRARRHLLPCRQPEGAALRPGQAHALCLLQRARHPAQPPGQADRRRRGGRGPGARHHTRQGGGERRRRPRMAGSRGHQPARTRPPRSCGIAVPQHRHRRQPRFDARLPGRRRERRRRRRLPCPDPVGHSRAGRIPVANRRRRADGARLRGAGQRHRPACARRRRAHRRHPARKHPAQASVQGQLLLAVRPRPVPSAGLSGAGGRRAGRPPDPRPWRPGTVRAGCAVGRPRGVRRRHPPRRRLLCCHPPVLAGLAGRRVDAGLCGHPPQDQRPQ